MAKQLTNLKEWRLKGESALRSALTEKREALRALRFGVTAAKTKNVRESRAVRRDIARLETVLAEKAS